MSKHIRWIDREYRMNAAAWLLLSFMLLTLPSQGASLPWLFSTADAVVVGTEADREKKGTLVSFTLTAERVFKGTITPGTSIHVTWDVGVYDAIWLNTSPSYRGIWALQNKEGLWSAIPVRAGQVPAFQRLFYPVPARPPGDDFAPQPGSSNIDESLGLIAAAEEERNGYEPLLLDAATDYDSAESRRIFGILARRVAGRVRLLGLAGLIQRGEVSGILQLDSADRNLNVPGVSDLTTRSVELFFRNTDARGIRALGHLATTACLMPGLQIAAARALSNVHTRESLPFLAALLDKPDPALVRAGVVGLSFYANGVGIQTATAGMEHLNYRTPTPYATDDTARYLGFDEHRRDEYVNFWKQWWTMHQRELE